MVRFIINCMPQTSNNLKIKIHQSIILYQNLNASCRLIVLARHSAIHGFVIKAILPQELHFVAEYPMIIFAKQRRQNFTSILSLFLFDENKSLSSIIFTILGSQNYIRLLFWLQKKYLQIQRGQFLLVHNTNLTIEYLERLLNYEQINWVLFSFFLQQTINNLLIFEKKTIWLYLTLYKSNNVLCALLLYLSSFENSIIGFFTHLTEFVKPKLQKARKKLNTSKSNKIGCSNWIPIIYVFLFTYF